MCKERRHIYECVFLSFSVTFFGYLIVSTLCPLQLMNGDEMSLGMTHQYSFLYTFIIDKNKIKNTHTLAHTHMDSSIHVCRKLLEI